MKIIQITDSHINNDPERRIFGLVNTENTFLDVLNSVKQENPDLVIATGDLSQDGSKESYERLKGYLNTLNCLVYPIYGNHDNPANFDQYLIGGNIIQERLLETPNATFIFLSSLSPGDDNGFISNEELNHLESSLNAYDNCIPVIHHHFVPIGSVIDKYITKNSEMLIDVLRKYKNKIKFCITGHVHGFHEYCIDNIKIYSSLSTCIQFAKTKELMFDNKKPGYTVYYFQGDTYEVVEKTI